jgi:hypothetical protein
LKGDGKNCAEHSDRNRRSTDFHVSEMPIFGRVHSAQRFREIQLRQAKGGC